MKIDSVGKKLTHPQGHGFNSRCRCENLFDKWSASTFVSAHWAFRSA